MPASLACMPLTIEARFERLDERGNPALADNAARIGDPDHQRPRAARARLLAASAAASPVVTVAPHDHSPTQRSRAQSRRPKAVLA